MTERYYVACVDCEFEKVRTAEDDVSDVGERHGQVFGHVVEYGRIVPRDDRERPPHERREAPDSRRDPSPDRSESGRHDATPPADDSGHPPDADVRGPDLPNPDADVEIPDPERLVPDDPDGGTPDAAPRDGDAPDEDDSGVASESVESGDATSESVDETGTAASDGRRETPADEVDVSAAVEAASGAGDAGTEASRTDATASATTAESASVSGTAGGSGVPSLGAVPWFPAVALEAVTGHPLPGARSSGRTARVVARTLWSLLALAVGLAVVVALAVTAVLVAERFGVDVPFPVGRDALPLAWTVVARVAG